MASQCESDDDREVRSDDDANDGFGFEDAAACSDDGGTCYNDDDGGGDDGGGNYDDGSTWHNDNASVCSDGSHEREPSEERHVVFGHVSSGDFFGAADENDNNRGGRRGRGRGNFRGGNKRNKKNRGARGNRGRGNFNNAGSSKNEDGGNESNMISECFKITDEDGNIVSNPSNIKSYKSRQEIHEMEAKCLIAQGTCHQKQEGFFSKATPINNRLLFGNDSGKKATIMTVNGNGNVKPAGNNGNNNNNNNNNKNNNNKNNNGNAGNKNANNNGNNNNNNGNNNNKNNNNNKGGGDFKWDVVSKHVKYLCYSMGLLKPDNGPGYTLESLCLKFHYRFLVLFFCISYFVVTLNWYVNEQIICYKLGASQTPQTGPYREMCLSYPFTMTAAGTRRYLLFYRWVPYSFLLAAAAVYTLRAGPVKKWENFRLSQLCRDVWMQRSNYEMSHWTDTNKRVIDFIISGQAESGHYLKWILCHVFANAVVLAAVFYFDFVLQGSFVTMIPDVMYKLHRDPMYFSDPMSTIFPPFAECQISPFHKVVDQNEFNFGCHLTLMELYEKMFFITWCVLALHWLWSSMMILWLSVALIPLLGKFSCLVTSHLKYKESAAAIWKAMRMCSLGEVHALYLVKRWMSCAQFDQLLTALLVEKEKERERLKRERKSGSSSGGETQNRCNNYTALQMEGFKLPFFNGSAHKVQEQLKTDPTAPTTQLLPGNPIVRYGDDLDPAYIDQFYSAQSSEEAAGQKRKNKP